MPFVHPEKGRYAPRLALIVAAVSMVAPFSIDAYLPSFPDIQRDLGISAAAMQQTLSFYLLAFAVGTLAHGPLSDKFGRRPVILFGLGLYVLCSAASALVTDFSTLLLLRIGQGLTASAGLVVGRAVVRDAFGGAEAQRVMSRVMLIFALAPAVAPIVGGILQEVSGWRSVFWFLTAMGAVVWLLAWRNLPETLAPEARRSIHPVKVTRAYRRAFFHPGFMAVVLCFTFAFAGMFLYVVGAPRLVFEHLGLGAADFAYIFVPMVSGVMLGSWLSGRLAQRLGAVRTVNAGFVVMTVAALLNAGHLQLWSPTVIGVVTPLALYATGMALALPAMLVVALDYFPRNRGTAAAVQGFMQTAGNALVAGLGVPLLGGTALIMAFGQLGFVLTGLAIWWGWRRFACTAAP
ncbi:multidrug effflux MFS transporter [Thiohalomonas denitrificans]|uniref:multidrug effflux MFS transporter n=1 Tax=Thiohalomonas denitrificans TaxID=415747 RepID=UPI0026F047FB|nr:multidrug effflux MFS transporter [Thiohalomonas denitrificans]